MSLNESRQVAFTDLVHGAALLILPHLTNLSPDSIPSMEQQGTFCAKLFHSFVLSVIMQGKLGIAAEHGFYIRRPSQQVWEAIKEDAGTGWRDMVQPIMKLYADSTDGSYTEEKESALVWNYSQADPDFGHWQVRPAAVSSHFLLRQFVVAGFRVHTSVTCIAAAGLTGCIFHSIENTGKLCGTGWKEHHILFAGGEFGMSLCLAACRMCWMRRPRSPQIMEQIMIWVPSRLRSCWTTWRAYSATSQ